MVISVSSHSLDEDGPETVDTETSAAPAGLSGFVFRANVNGFRVRRPACTKYGGQPVLSKVIWHTEHSTFFRFIPCLDQTCYPEREARDAEYIQLYNELETTLHLQPNLFIEQNKCFSTVRFPVETFHQLAT